MYGTRKRVGVWCFAVALVGLVSGVVPAGDPPAKEEISDKAGSVQQTVQPPPAEGGVASAPTAKAHGLSESERASKAAAVLEAVMATKGQGIPHEILGKARAIAVIPQVANGGAAGEPGHGKGLVIQRMNDGAWSRPVYVDVGGASHALQPGAEATDLVLVFVKKDGLESLLNDAIKLGADVSVTAGPVGATAETDSGQKVDSAIYAYSRSKGVFSGASLDGAVISLDKGANQLVYGPDVDARGVLNEAGKVPEPLAPFMKAVQGPAEG